MTTFLQEILKQKEATVQMLYNTMGEQQVDLKVIPPLVPLFLLGVFLAEGCFP